MSEGYVDDNGCVSLMKNDSYTNGNPFFLRINKDGTILAKDGKPRWDIYLSAHVNGRVVIHRIDGTPLWRKMQKARTMEPVPLTETIPDKEQHHEQGQ